MFDQIAIHLFEQTKLITAPGAVDPRWPALVAQAYREGIAAWVGQHPGGLLLRMQPDGALGFAGLDAADVED